MESDARTEELKMNPAELYQEEIYTDLRVGTIRRLTPVQSDGSRDEARPILYVGQAQVYTPAGALPLNFELEASTLEEAVAKFGDAANAAVDRAMEELKEMRRQAASQLVVPEGGDLGGMGGMGGGMPGGGKIQMP